MAPACFRLANAPSLSLVESPLAAILVLVLVLGVLAATLTAATTTTTSSTVTTCSLRARLGHGADGKFMSKEGLFLAAELHHADVHHLALQAFKGGNKAPAHGRGLGN
jgi:hypothetical protein